MKKHSSSTYTLALVAVAVPSLLFGAVITSAASTFTDPKELHYELFDLAAYKLQRRAAHTVKSAAPEHKAATTVSPESPCDTKTEQTDDTVTSDELSLGDLSPTERDALWKQLRIGGCPQDVLSGYKALCEEMLKRRGPRVSLPGLVNPRQ